MNNCYSDCNLLCISFLLNITYYRCSLLHSIYCHNCCLQFCITRRNKTPFFVLITVAAKQTVWGNVCRPLNFTVQRHCLASTFSVLDSCRLFTGKLRKPKRTKVCSTDVDNDDDDELEKSMVFQCSKLCGISGIYYGRLSIVIEVIWNKKCSTGKLWILRCNHYVSYSVKCFPSFVIRSLTSSYGTTLPAHTQPYNVF